jgi:hypothetical protein
MPEQQITCASEHAETLELGASNFVAALAVGRMSPKHVGLGAQTQVLYDGGMDRGLGRTAPIARAVALRQMDHAKCPFASAARIVSRGNFFVENRRASGRRVV